MAPKKLGSYEAHQRRGKGSLWGAGGAFAVIDFTVECKRQQSLQNQVALSIKRGD